MNLSRILMASLLLGASGVAQAAGTGSSTGASSSATYFISAVEFSSGGEADSLFYKVRSAVGSGVVTEPDASSTTYRIRGGFFGAFTAPMLGTPWITGASPMFVKPSGSQTLTLHGTELWTGTGPIVTVGGAAASVVSRTASQAQVTVPPQPIPGYQPVTFTTSAGQTKLDSGVGVMPMVETREPLNGWDPNFLRFHVSAGDFVILGLATSLFPAGITIADWKYKLLLDPNEIVLTDSYFVGDPEGKLTLTIPPFFASGQVHVQALVLTNDPTYAPASFTNVQSL